MNINIHIFAVLSTIIFYFLLKSFKYSNLQNQKNIQKQSNLIYILFAPVVIYSTYYLFIYKKENPQSQFTNLQKETIPMQNILNEKLSQSNDLPSIYPIESTLSNMS